jgi:S1-C subfamily serine protease
MQRAIRSVPTTTLLATLAVLAAAPGAAQMRRDPAPAPIAPALPTPRQIAADAHAALLVIRALGEHGDTIGLGTGFMISPDGLFITNYHVIQEAARLRVKVLDGPEYEGVSLVAGDPASDLAVMQIPGINHARALKLGSDAEMEVGDRVFVMGNPLGMSGTFTDGMISGKRPLEGVALLQISAPISAGSSGGPVMNERGEVIGVATMMVMGGQNLNIAVPARYVQPMLAQHAAPRPFSPAVLVANPHSGLALVGEGDAPEQHAGRAAAPEREPQQEVEEQFSIIRPMLQIRGFSPAFPASTGEVPQAQGATQDYPLEKGVTYVITARCDAGCHDLDLALQDSRGRLLQSDVDGDDYPTLRFVPASSGLFRVTVKIAQCATASCAYGVGVFRLDRAQSAPRASTSSARSR